VTTPGRRTLPRSRDWRLLFGAYLVSTAGDELTTVAVLARAHEVGVSLTSVVAVVMAKVVPPIVVGPVAGALADRSAKRRLLVTLHLAAPPLAAGLAFATTAPILLVLVAALAGLTSAVRPAEVAWEPQLLPDERELFVAASVRTAARNTLSILGPAAAGLLVVFGGSAAAFFVDAATYLAATVLLLAIRSRGAPAVTDESLPPHSDGAAPSAVAIIWRSAELRAIVLAFAAVVLVTALQPPVLFVYVQQDLAGGAAFYGLLLATMGAGSVCASAMLARRGRLSSRGRLLLVVLVLPFDGLALVVLGTAKVLAVIVGCAFAMGALSAVFGSTVRYTVQVATDERVRGRVVGLLYTVQGPAEIASLLAVPVVAGGVAPGTVLAGSGLVEAVLAGVVYLLIRRSRVL
jgi:MFS family permease